MINNTERRVDDTKTKSKPLTKEDINEGKKIAELFAGLDEVSEAMALTYLSALRDKQLVDEKPEKAS